MAKHKTTHKKKIEALLDLIGELNGQPLLVAYQFKHDLARIGVAIGGVSVINGDTSPAETDVIVEQWNLGNIPVLCCHPASMAHGLNMQAGGRHVCWFGMTDDLELYEQLNARLFRQGQEGQVMIYRILAADTVDIKMRDRIEEKASIQNMVLEGLG